MKNTDLWTFLKQTHFIPSFEIFLFFFRVNFEVITVQVQRGGASVFQPIRNPALKGGGLSALRFGRPTAGKDRVHFVQGAGWASRPVRTARKISPHRNWIHRSSSP